MKENKQTTNKASALWAILFKTQHLEQLIRSQSRNQVAKS